MKWFLLIIVVYTSFWYFLGWGIDGSVLQMILSLSLFLASALVAVFNYQNTFVKKALIMLYMPFMIVYAILKHLDSMEIWRIVFIIIALVIQIALFFFYIRAKAKKKKTL